MSISVSGNNESRTLLAELTSIQDHLDHLRDTRREGIEVSDSDFTSLKKAKSRVVAQLNALEKPKTTDIKV